MASLNGKDFDFKEMDKRKLGAVLCECITNPGTRNLNLVLEKSEIPLLRKAAKAENKTIEDFLYSLILEEVKIKAPDPIPLLTHIYDQKMGVFLVSCVGAISEKKLQIFA